MDQQSNRDRSTDCKGRVDSETAQGQPRPATGAGEVTSSCGSDCPTLRQPVERNQLLQQACHR